MNEHSRISTSNIDQNDSEADVPSSIEAEQQLLGALLAKNSLFHKISGNLEADHFFDPVHARIFKTIAACVSRDRLASPITIKHMFASDDGLKELGGPKYLVNLVGSSIGENFIVEYADLIIETAERRRLYYLTSESADSLKGGAHSSEVVERLEGELIKSTSLGSSPKSMSLIAAATKSISEMHDRFMSGSTGVPSGIEALDYITGGFHRAEFTIIAGATSMGKTAVGTWIAHAAAKQGFGVGYATLEMGESQLYQRINSIDSRIPYQDQRRSLTEETVAKIAEAAQKQAHLPIELFNSEVRSVHGIFSEARKLQRRWEPNGDFKGLGMLVIDYIQLLKGQGTTLEVLAEAAIECKNIAKRLDIPVIALAQVNRTIGQRENKVPTLSDLRGSGDLEFAADNVIFCHRPEYYLSRELQNSDLEISDRADIEAALAACRNKMDLFVAKQRMGTIDQCKVSCDMATNRFWQA